MAVSSIPAVKAALKTALRALPALTGVQVSYGLPPTAQKELVTIDGARGAQSYSSLGARYKDEKYALDMRVSVIRGAANQQDATERAFVIYSAIEAYVRLDPSIGGTCRVANLGADFELTEHADAARREGLIEFSLDITARI